MNTKFTSWVLLPLFLSVSFTATSKLSESMIKADTQPSLELNIEQEINLAMTKMLANMQTKVQTTNINKQLNNDALTLQTNELVSDVDNQMPNFKFKVIIAE